MTLPISRDRFFDKLHHMIAKEMKGRVHGMQRHIVKSIAQSALDGVQTMAPKEDPDLGNYARDLKLVMVDQKDISYAFVYKGKPISSEEQDTDTTVLDVKYIDRKKAGRWPKIFDIMGEYGPFTLNTWPLSIPKDKAYIIFRKVSKSEVRLIEERNKRQANEIRLRLRETGMRLTMHDFGTVRNDLQVHQDMAFTVIRKELGISVRPRPHWKPGIRKSRSSAAIGKAVNSREVASSMLDMNYQGWDRLGMMDDKVSKSDLKEIQDFQGKIIRGV